MVVDNILKRTTLLCFSIIAIVMFFLNINNVKAKEKECMSEQCVNYTVEFNYNNKAYVMKGDTILKLSDVLDYLDIKGRVSSYKVSNSELFDIVKKDGVLYIEAKKAFNTFEWLDVDVDRIKYHIIVTDDIIKISGGSKTVDIEGVHQGTLSDFAAEMPVATIFIDEKKLNSTAASRNSAIYGSFDTSTNTFTPDVLGSGTSGHAGFEIEDTGADDGFGSANYRGRKFLIFNLNKENLSYSETGESSESQKNYFGGEILTYKWNDGAQKQKADGTFENLDVYVTYSNLMITLEKDVKSVYDSMKTDTKLGLWGGNMLTVGLNGNNGSGYTNGRYAFTVDINIVVRDKNGTIVPGTYYYQAVDIDVSRMNSSGKPITNFEDFYRTNPYDANYEIDRHGYSEQFWLRENFGDIYIPGGTGDTQNYKSNIELMSDKTYRIYPMDNASNNGGTDNNTFYSGFLTYVNNTKGGLKLTYYGSSGKSGGGMETYVLAGSTQINHKLKSTTVTYKLDGTKETDGKIGGTIETTFTGNHEGDLSNGDVYGPTTITTATGQEVVYTITPQKGYKLKKAMVANNTIDYTKGSTVSLTPVDSNSDGIPEYYTYTFSNIIFDNAIHVEWEPISIDLEIKKETINGDDDFEFTVNFWTEDANNIKTPYNLISKPDTATKKADGEYTFKLSNAEKITFSKIPYDVYWLVSENLPSGWVQKSKTNDVGKVTETSQLKIESIFKNELEFHNLKIIKIVDEVTTDDFNFTLKLWNDQVDGTNPYSLKTPLPDGVSGSDGVYKVKITGGNEIAFPNIPAYVWYKVEEDAKEDWRLKNAINTSAQMLQDNNAVFTNNIVKKREIILRKNWIDFNNIYDIRPEDLQGYIKYKFEGVEITVNTEANKWVKDSNSWTYKFIIPTESEVLQWGEKTTPNEYEFSRNNVLALLNIYEMTNTLVVNHLVINHEVIGNAADTSKEFKITIKLKNANGLPVTGKFTMNKNGINEEIIFADNGAEIVVKHNDKISIKNLLRSYSFVIEMEETDYTSYNQVETGNGTVTTLKGKRVLASGDLQNGAKISFINELKNEEIEESKTEVKKETPPKTFDEIMIYVGVLLISLAIIGYILLKIFETKKLKKKC